MRDTLPRRVVVAELISGRYEPGARPVSWDSRRAGRETVRSTSGEVLELSSSGGQSTPAAGWELLLMKSEADSGFAWTLFGVQRTSEH